jgi:phosphoribosyl-ATP pyrophosphohydrolase/phosphoribosyl-AMP cyclohydrolase
MKVFRPNFEKRGGLVIVVALDGTSREVLMVAYANEAAWRRTLETGRACYYSTSREKLWTKGEESGNFQKVTRMLIDCDGDALIYLVEPHGEGKACHTGARSCFYREVIGRVAREDAPKAGAAEDLSEVDIPVHPQLLEKCPNSSWTLRTLEGRLEERAKVSPAESYTRKLLDKGVRGCAKKFGEETTETVIAATSEADERLIAESADVMYHLLVLLMSRGLSFAAVEEELQRRENMSGLVEKAARSP